MWLQRPFGSSTSVTLVVALATIAVFGGLVVYAVSKDYEVDADMQSSDPPKIRIKFMKRR